MVKHALDEVSRHEDLLGEDVQELVVDCDVTLHPKLRHLPQGCVNELHVAPAANVLPNEYLKHPVKHGLGPGLHSCLLKQAVMGNQGPLMSGMSVAPGNGLVLKMPKACMESS